MYKVKHNLSPKSVNEIFTQVDIKHLRTKVDWEIPRVRTVNKGIETIRYRGIKTWEILPSDIKHSKSLNEFRTKIKIWKPSSCTCRLCKTFIPNLGFI